MATKVPNPNPHASSPIPLPVSPVRPSQIPHFPFLSRLPPRPASTAPLAPSTAAPRPPPSGSPRRRPILLHRRPSSFGITPRPSPVLRPSPPAPRLRSSARVLHGHAVTPPPDSRLRGGGSFPPREDETTSGVLGFRRLPERRASSGSRAASECGRPSSGSRRLRERPCASGFLRLCLRRGPFSCRRRGCSQPHRTPCAAAPAKKSRRLASVLSKFVEGIQSGVSQTFKKQKGSSPEGPGGAGMTIKS